MEIGIDSFAAVDITKGPPISIIFSYSIDLQ